LNTGARQPAASQNRRKSYWRLLWAAVLLLHAPITIGVFSAIWTQSGPIRWSSVLLLTLANAFFVFEVVCAYSLRILSDRRKVITFLVVIALLHVGVIERAMPDFVHNADIQYWLLLASASVASIAVMLRVLRAISLKIATALATNQHPHASRDRYARRVDLEHGFRSAVFGPLWTPPRAPPQFSL